jgi:hypothetical protein
VRTVLWIFFWLCLLSYVVLIVAFILHYAANLP